MIPEIPKILMCYEKALDGSIERCGSLYKNGTKNTEKFSNPFLKKLIVQLRAELRNVERKKNLLLALKNFLRSENVQDMIAEAFGLPESEFIIQIFKFRKGEWLLINDDSTSLESIPIPIYVENAEEVVREFLNCERGA